MTLNYCRSELAGAVMDTEELAVWDAVVRSITESSESAECDGGCSGSELRECDGLRFFALGLGRRFAFLSLISSASFKYF